MWVLAKDAKISQALEAMGGVPAVYRGGAKRFTDRLIMPSSARNLVVQVPALVTGELELGPREDAVWKMDMTGAGTILRLFSQRPRSQRLRTLSITLGILNWVPFYHDMPFRAESSGLPPLNAPSLRKMEFRMYPDERIVGSPDQNSMPPFKEALDELGMALIGGEGHKTINVDSKPVAVLTYTRKIKPGKKMRQQRRLG